ncbi:hypothetical protein VTN77DRAFT_4819 [Rasamsonia byssochlamydoides]|uniref:uncharacterized protein n=1 Tax=Rasamsonia byssochlamydoides TaxID=89139 RepID=UPI003743A028
MERLSLHDNPAGPPQLANAHHGHPPQNVAAPPPLPPSGHPPPMMPPQGPPQLPPQMFTTAAQLLDLTDKKLVLVLRDGRKLIGVLRSWDQFANLVLQDTVERLYAGNLYADVPRGLYLVRGENVLLLGEIDLDKEDDIPPFLTKASPQEVFELKKKEENERKSRDKKRHSKLQGLGFEPEHSGEVLF